MNSWAGHELGPVENRMAKLKLKLRLQTVPIRATYITGTDQTEFLAI